MFRSLRRRFLQLAVPLIKFQCALHCTNQIDWNKRCRQRLLPSNLAKGESCSQRASPQGSLCPSALLCFSFGHVAHIGRSRWHYPAFEEASGRSVVAPLSATQLWRLRNLGVSPLNAAWDAQSARAGSLRHRSERWVLRLESHASDVEIASCAAFFCNLAYVCLPMHGWLYGCNNWYALLARVSHMKDVEIGNQMFHLQCMHTHCP